jgi:tetratricopeptide (TPR) repeat protein
MTDSLHYIDSYIKGEFSAEEQKIFEQRIVNDPQFAEEVAFYVTSVNLLREDLSEHKKASFRKIYAANKQTQAPVRNMRPWYWAAAAVIAVITIGVFFFNTSHSPNEIADRYIKQHLMTFGVMMGAEKDSMQRAVDLYNTGNVETSLQYFQSILQSHPSEYKAREYAGIVSLRLKEYDKALAYFEGLADDQRLYANPGKFYQALTLLKRNLPGDKARAQSLLRQVVNEGLENDQAAKDLLDQL